MNLNLNIVDLLKNKGHIKGALAVVHHPPYFGYIHLEQERRVRTAPPVSVRVSVSFSVTVLCLQLWMYIFLMCSDAVSYTHLTLPTIYSV